MSLATTAPLLFHQKELADFRRASVVCTHRQHRRIIITALKDPSHELPFTTRALAFDSKNYHTWAYRQWVLSHFFADSQETWAGELEFTRNLLTADVRNNSAWNHRWFTVFERSQPASQDVVGTEIR